MGKRHGLGARMFSDILHENGLYGSSAVPTPNPHTQGAIESKLRVDFWGILEYK